MTLQQLFETIFDLCGKVRIEGDQRNVYIARNPKREYIMRKIESALDVIDRMGIKDATGFVYDYLFADQASVRRPCSRSQYRIFR